MTIHHWRDEDGNDWIGNYDPEEERREMEARCNTHMHEAGHLPGFDQPDDSAPFKGILIGMGLSTILWIIIGIVLVVVL